MPLSVRAATEATSSVAALCRICAMPMTPCTKSLSRSFLEVLCANSECPPFPTTLLPPRSGPSRATFWRERVNRRRQMRRHSIDPLPSPEKSACGKLDFPPGACCRLWADHRPLGSYELGSSAVSPPAEYTQQSTFLLRYSIFRLDLKRFSCCLVTPASSVMLHSVGAHSRTTGYFLTSPQLVDSSTRGKAFLRCSKPFPLIQKSSVGHFPTRRLPKFPNKALASTSANHNRGHSRRPYSTNCRVRAIPPSPSPDPSPARRCKNTFTKTEAVP